MLSPSPSTLAALLGLFAITVYLLYRKAIPTPIPGIPYTPAALRPFGDVSAALSYQAKTDLMTEFMTDKCLELSSPIVQVFMEPFKKPWVIISDPITTEDILTRRTKEFDVSRWFTGVFEAVTPNSHLHLRTNEHWRRRRRAINDVMSGDFLHKVAGPRAYEACLAMADLWTEKVRLAGNRPFSVTADIEDMLLDNIWVLAFGSSIGSTQAQKALLRSLAGSPVDAKNGSNLVAILPEASRPPAFDTIVTISDSHQIPIQSPIGPVHHKLALSLYPKLRRAARNRDVMISERLEAAWHNAMSETNEIACAADSLIRRERLLAEKEQRRPVYDDPAIRDDLYIFLQAGNDTSATTLQWALKYLTANQQVQSKLRSALHQTYGSSELPSSLHMTRANIPYLEAVVEEVLRCSAPVGVVARETKSDCRILGYQVPARTNVIMTTCGPGYRSPPIHNPKIEPFRTDSQFKSDWDPETLSDFKPERWLCVDREGKTHFMNRAGATHAMGTGTRHCWGKPLAMLSLRMFISLIVLRFDLQPLPPSLEEFEAMQRMTHRPRTVYIRPRRYIQD